MSQITIKDYRIRIRRLPKEFSGYRILQISDVHMGRCDRADAIVALAAKCPVDLVALTGDIADRQDTIDHVRPFLARLVDAIDATDGCVSIYGNHDKHIRKQDIEDLPIRWLDNETVLLRRGSSVINLMGVNQQVWASTDLLKTLANAVPDVPKILLAHYPSTIFLLNGLIDLVIAGHTHAGQIRVPGLPFATNDNIPCRFGRGTRVVHKTQLIVSNGLGYSGPVCVRFFSPPQLTRIELTT